MVAESTAGAGYPPIEDYGIIGDGHTAALVSREGSIDWLCLPRFDSPSLFARILDVQRGGAWRINPTGAFEADHRYVEDTNVLETVFDTASGRVRVLDFMAVAKDAEDPTSDPPRVLVRVVEGIEGEVEVESVCSPRPDYAREEPEITVLGERAKFAGCVLSGPVAWDPGRDGCEVRCVAVARAGERAAFTLAYEDSSRVAAVEQPLSALREAVGVWRAWAGRCAYEGPYREAVVRSALTLKLLDYSPTGAIVAAPTTSLPEEVGGERNWDYRFAWIRDASFTLYALLLAGYTDEDDAFFAWIVRNVELEGKGIRILHAIAPDGETEEFTLDHLDGYRGSRPVRIGNGAHGQVQLDVYGEVLGALYFAWRVGRFDPRPVWGYFRGLVDWVADNWGRQGSGIWEVRGGLRNFVYSKAMLWVALDRGAGLAEELGLPGDAGRWRREGEKLRAEILEKGYSERLGAFKQSYEDEYLDASNLMLPIIGFVDGDDPRMLSTIDATLDGLVVDGLCYRYLDAPEGLRGKEAAFVLCTFWLVEALVLAGRGREARELYERMVERATPLGLFAEEIHPGSGAHLGNFPQALSHIGVISAAGTLARAGVVGAVDVTRAEAARAGERGDQKAAPAHDRTGDAKGAEAQES